MNPAQRLVVAAAAALALAVIVYPSWIETYTRDDGAFARTDHGRHFLWDKPDERTDLPSQGVRVHSSERSGWLMGIAVGAITLYFVCKRGRDAGAGSG